MDMRSVRGGVEESSAYPAQVGVKGTGSGAASRRSHLSWGLKVDGTLIFQAQGTERTRTPTQNILTRVENLNQFIIAEYISRWGESEEKDVARKGGGNWGLGTAWARLAFGLEDAVRALTAGGSHLGSVSS